MAVKLYILDPKPKDLTVSRLKVNTNILIRKAEPVFVA